MPPVKTLLPRLAEAYESLYAVAAPPAGSPGTPAAAASQTPASSMVAAPSARDVALRLAVDWARELTPGLSESDFITLALFLMLFLHARDAGVDPRETRSAIAELRRCESSPESILFAYFSSCPPTYVAETLRKALASLTLKDMNEACQAAAAAAEHVLSITYASSINLEKIYAVSRSKVIMIRVKDPVTVYERLVAFAGKQRQQQQQQQSLSSGSFGAALSRPVIIDAKTHEADHFW
jgi:hypothetical protein